MEEQELNKEILEHRKTNYPVHPLIHNRWSPRSMSGEEMTDEELMPLFEAARLSPSSFNGQPWRFIYAKRNTPAWAKLFDLMIAFNQSWTKNASALVVVISRDTSEHNNAFSRTHSYDTGAAWMALALEGSYRGYVVHGMSGFDYEKAKISLQVPDGYTVEAMIAIGKPAPKEKLPEELQKKEVPSGRKALNQVLMEGSFKG